MAGEDTRALPQALREGGSPWHLGRLNPVVGRVFWTLWRGNSFPGGPRALTRVRLPPLLQRLPGRSLNTSKRQKEQYVTPPPCPNSPLPELSTDTEWAIVKDTLPWFIHHKKVTLLCPLPYFSILCLGVAICGGQAVADPSLATCIETSNTGNTAKGFTPPGKSCRKSGLKGSQDMCLRVAYLGPWDPQASVGGRWRSA